MYVPEAARPVQNRNTEIEREIERGRGRGRERERGDFKSRGRAGASLHKPFTRDKENTKSACMRV
jgi:hypothetical protein